MRNETSLVEKIVVKKRKREREAVASVISSVM